MEMRIEVVRYRDGAVFQSWGSDAHGYVVAQGVRGCVRRDGDEIVLHAHADTDVEETGIDLLLTLPHWSGGYVVVPGAIYDGNRFRVLSQSYPPMYEAEETDRSPAITDVPRLPSFHLLAGDASYPAVAFWSESDGSGGLISFPAQTELGFVGLQVEEREGCLTVRIQFPGVRDRRYTMVTTGSPSFDRGANLRAGWDMGMRVAVAKIEGAELDDIFALLHESRNRIEPAGERGAVRSLSSVAELIENEVVWNRWQADPGFFLTADTDHGIPFQVGWVGGGIVTLPLLESGNPIARERACTNIHFICESLQAPSGFFYGGYRNGPYNDGFDHPHAEHWGMVRKSGDMLLFLMRHILTLRAMGEEIPRSWTLAARRCAEAFVRTRASFGEWGQFIDVRDGRVVVSGSACGGTAIAGLALASVEFDEPRFLFAAEEGGSLYEADCVREGHLTGGPGEILKAPDSESAFGLVEGYIVLWETTGNARWIEEARKAARQAASWVVSYDFPFPTESTFGRMEMRTAGTVIANVQNKHSAPGICTLSALSLLKLYRATGERKWLELAVEISHALPQYVSTAERPIIAEDGRPLPPGWVNERVNMSDWEVPQRGLGEVYCGPCWSMASVLLTALEMPGVYIDPNRGIVAAADHVEACIDGGVARLSNPTPFHAKVKVMVDQDRSRPLGELWWRSATVVELPAGGSVDLPLPSTEISQTRPLAAKGS